MHRGGLHKAASTSPSSMRKPQSLTWWSSRPGPQGSPVASATDRSPVTYHRAGPRSQERVLRKRFAVSSGRSR